MWIQKRKKFIQKLIEDKIRTPKIIGKYSFKIPKNKFVITQKLNKNRKH